MPDLERLLDEFDRHDRALPPSAAEIRHRGDRLRRRNRALAVVGSAVAVAVIATPLALLNRNDEQSAPPAPADRPAPTSVPDDLPLAFELPASNGDGTPVVVTAEPSVAEIGFCADPVWTPAIPHATTDVAGTTYTGRDGARAARTIAVYADAGAAADAFDAIRDGLGDGCSSGDESHEPRPADPGVLTYRSATTDASGRRVRELVDVQRFGNALYLEATDTSIGHSGYDGRLVDALRVFEGDVVPRLEGELGRNPMLYSDVIPGVEQLPDDELVSALGPWEAVEVGDTPDDPCRPDDDLADLGPSTRYVGRFVAGSDPDDQAVIRITVADFPDPAAARTAARAVQTWQGGSCASATSPDGEAALAGGGSSGPDGHFSSGYTLPRDDGTSRTYLRVGGVDGRLLALVSYSVVHDGPEPAALDDAAAALVDDALDYVHDFEAIPGDS